jgi:hypothetical protein
MWHCFVEFSLRSLHVWFDSCYTLVDFYLAVRKDGQCKTVDYCLIPIKFPLHFFITCVRLSPVKICSTGKHLSDISAVVAVHGHSWRLQFKYVNNVKYSLPSVEAHIHSNIQELLKTNLIICIYIIYICHICHHNTSRFFYIKCCDSNLACHMTCPSLFLPLIVVFSDT